MGYFTIKIFGKYDCYGTTETMNPHICKKTGYIE